MPVAGLSKDAYWDCGFEFRWQYGCQSLVSIAYCQVDVSATGRSLVLGSATVRAVSLCDQVQQ